MKSFGPPPTAHNTPFGRKDFQEYPTKVSTDADSKKPTVMMIMIVILTFALGVTTTLLLMKPRTVTVVEQPVAPPKPMSLAEAVAASLDTDVVTRAEPMDLLTPAPAIAGVIAGLQPEASPLAPAPQETQAPSAEAAVLQAEKDAQRALGLHMRMLKEAVLAGVYTVEARENNGKRQLMLRPINLEISRRFMKNLLRTAEKRGEITFPEGLSTENGEVDLDTMLFNLVQNALIREGTVEGAKAAREMIRRAFEATGTEVSQLTGTQEYIVEPGDSLAYISLKFYGRPGAYRRIFEANRSLLKSPDRIQVGQRLVIPG